MSNDLRINRQCQAKSASLIFTLCTGWAVEKRDDGLWVCADHRDPDQAHATSPGTDMRKRGRHRRPEPHELLGVPVMVVNPHNHTVWLGRGIALSERPSILIEDDRGHRFMLPLEWATPRFR